MLNENGFHYYIKSRENEKEENDLFENPEKNNNKYKRYIDNINKSKIKYCIGLNKHVNILIVASLCINRYMLTK